ncbi:uncharacterized protein LAESUDRAFT_625545, partial [Laetiporus sulphureus 93-53]
WLEELTAAGCLGDFSDVSIGIRDGFCLGVSSRLTSTYISRNHKSASDHPEAVALHISTELAACQYFGPFHPDHLESLIGPFCT